MSDDRELDIRIRKIVRSIDRHPSEGLERRIRERTVGIETSRRRGPDHGLIWIATSLAAVALVLGVLILSPAFRNVPASEITEIRTEFEIADKNIKIIFIQRSDFRLMKEIKP